MITERKTRPLWYRLDKLAVFTYKIIVWFFLGIIAGSFLAMMQGLLGYWFIPVNILGTIVIGAALCIVFIRYTERRAERTADRALQGHGRAVPARIDRADFAGIRMMETHELLSVTCTVFPPEGAPYQTTVRQFFTIDERERLELLAGQTTVTFYEDPYDRGYGTLSAEEASEGLPDGVQDTEAHQVYPERRGRGLLLLVGRTATAWTRTVSMALIVALVGFGFFSPYIVTGNVGFLRMRVKYFPQRLIFQYKGNYNPDAFKMAFDRAREYIGDRRIESLLFYKDMTHVGIEMADKPGYTQTMNIRGNSVLGPYLSSMEADTARLFTLDDVRYDLLQKALDDVATDHDVSDIGYIGVRKDIRWGTRDGRVKPDYDRYHTDIHVVFWGGDESLNYHGETGERMEK